MKVIVLILAGGSGSRLWPLSRQNMPKQLLSLTGSRTLMQETCRRFFPLVPASDQWIITGGNQYDLVQKQVTDLRQETGCADGADFIQVLAEPQGKNTAPAIFWAARRCQQLYGDDTVMLVVPSDHLIMQADDYLKAMAGGIARASEGYLLTFGIRPTHPETGYGYIKIDQQVAAVKQHDRGLLLSSYPVAAFVEKPDLATAERYLADGHYLWNSGMFAFHVGTLLAEGLRLAPQTAEPFLGIDPEAMAEVERAYSQALPQSIDYAVMEGTNRAYVLPATFGWSDVGCWQSIYELGEQDEQGNVQNGNCLILGSTDCLVYGGERLVAVVGLQGMAIVDTPDALMVCPLKETQRVREIVAELKKQGSDQY